MKKFQYIFMILFFLFSATSLYAKADIYLATGILTDEYLTDEAVKDLKADLIASKPEVYASQAFKSAYNTSHSLWDLIESGAQLLGQNGWTKYWDGFITLTNSALTQYFIDYFSGVSKNHDVDLTEQITNYQASINAGNQVIVIAHSQGNYFTNEAYEALDDCQKKSFYMLATANPASKVSGEEDARGYLATLDNDPITYVPSSMSANIINSERETVETALSSVDLKHWRFHFFDYYQHDNSVTKDKIESFPAYAIEHFKLHMNSTPTQGSITVSLDWSSPNINLDLSVALNGQKDIFDICAPTEHFVSEPLKTLEVGEYPVYVSYQGGLKEEDFPQRVVLSIKTSKNMPAKNIPMIFTHFNQGASMHIADIVISNGEPELVKIPNNNENNSGGGSGGGGGGGGSAGYSWFDLQLDATEEIIAYVVPKISQALAGPLSNAKIELFNLEDNLENTTPLYEGKTLAGNSMISTGMIIMPFSITNALNPDDMYIVQISGGLDIDVDDDAVIDNIPTPNHGKLRVVLRGSDIVKQNFKVSAITEMAYQVIKPLIENGAENETIEAELDNISHHMMKRSNATKEDLWQWIPSLDKDKLRRDILALKPILDKIHNNEDIYQDAYDFIYLPYIPDIEIHIYEDINLDTIVDIINFNQTVIPIENINLLSQGDNNFSINDKGEIRLTPQSKIDYETQKEYLFDLNISNRVGNYNTKLHIYIENILDAPELENLETYVLESAAKGALIAQLSFQAGSPITQIEVSPPYDRYFQIDNNGAVTILEEGLLDYETSDIIHFEIVAYNSYGHSLPATILFTITNDLDVAELSNHTFRLLENAQIGEKVGDILFRTPEDAPVTQITLFENGSEYFSVDANGSVSFVGGVLLDYETEKCFYLKAVAKNNYGESLPRNVTICLLNTPETAPKLKAIKKNIVKETASTSIITSILLATGDTEITEFILSPDSPFRVDLNGNITLVRPLDVDVKHYHLQARAKNDFAWSDSVDVNISIVAIDDYTSVLFDGFTSHAKIGHIEIFDDVSSVVLTGEGSEDFNLSIDGSLHVASGVTLHSQKQSEYNLTLIADDTFESKINIKLQNKRIIGALDMPDKPISFDLLSNSLAFYIYDVNYAQATSSGTTINISNSYEPIIDSNTYSNHIKPPNTKSTIQTKDGTKKFIATSSGLRVDDTTHQYSYNHFTIGTIPIPSGINMFLLSSDETKAYAVGGNNTFYIIDIRDIHPLELTDISEVIEENSTIGAYVGTVLDSNEGIVSATLSGEGASDFNIGLDGVIRLNNTLNYSNQKLYNLKATITNSITTKKADVTIRIHSVPEIQDFSTKIMTQTQGNTLVGTLDMWLDDASTIESISLSGEGSERFIITTSGEIYVASGVELKHTDVSAYTLHVSATNSYGVSQDASVEIYVTTVLASIPMQGYSTHDMILFQNDTRLLVSFGSEIYIYDISDTRRPSVISNITIGFNADIFLALSLDETKIYAVGNNALNIIDISDRAVPSILSTVNFSWALNLTLSPDGTKVLVADPDAGLYIVDVSNPISPNIIGFLESPHSYQAIMAVTYLPIENDKVIISSYYGDSLIDEYVDISNPNAPLLLGASPLGFKTIFSNDGEKAYAGKYIYDITDIDNIISLGSINISGQWVADVALSSNESKMFLLNGSGLHIADLNNFESVFRIPSVTSSRSYYDLVAFADDSKVIISGTNAIEIMDTCNLMLPTLTTFTKDIFEDISIGSIIGEVYSGNSSYNFQLSGAGSEYFAISNKGVLSIADNLASSPINTYQLTASMSNACGAIRTITFNVNTLDSIAPKINEGIFTINEDVDIGTIIGNIVITSSGSSDITAFELIGEGADDFSINLDGNITLVNPLDFELKNNYSLQAIATNSQGSSSVPIKINIKNISNKELTFMLNVDTEVGDYVGQVEMDDKNILSFELIGEGVEYFSISLDGTISLKKSLINEDYEKISDSKYILQATANYDKKIVVVDITINILAEPIIQEYFSASISVDTVAGTLIGTIDLGLSDIDDIEFEDYNDLFRITEKGDIYISDLASFLQAYVNQTLSGYIYVDNFYGIDECLFEITIEP